MINEHFYEIILTLKERAISKIFFSDLAYNTIEKKITHAENYKAFKYRETFEIYL